MHFSHLQNIPIKVLADTFNQAFSDYVIPMHFTAPQLADKLLRDGINLEHSVGAFSAGRLVGLILQGVGDWEGKLTAYNGGTGVIPAYRGKKITQQLYHYSIPLLKAKGVEQFLLEVVTTNEVALKTYQALGFNITRTLESYRGLVKPSLESKLNQADNIIYRPEADLNWDQLPQFWNYKPSWQYAFPAIERVKSLTRFIGVYNEEQLIGYGVINLNTNRVAQFAINPAYRRLGYGYRLFCKLTPGHSVPLYVINVEDTSTETTSFLKAIGLHKFLTQYEMTLPI